MEDIEPTEDIYNNLPIDLFTNDYDEFEIESLSSEIDGLSSENSDSLKETENEVGVAVNHSLEILQENTSYCDEIREDSILDRFENLNLESSKSCVPSEEINVPISNLAIEDENSSMWIRCVRCGKKNEIDCNFCGKCGLQIHKTISIAEPETEGTINPEITRNIKYHYMRPVFCFGAQGKCFASFSSPSKSVRNLAKFQLSTLKEFREDLQICQTSKSKSENNFPCLDCNDLKGCEHFPNDSILKDITCMISRRPTFILDEILRSNLREFFANISPKDLGSIKMLATQDSVSYLRGEIDEVFHLLVIGKTMEACELCIKFNYWDHALIIAKTLDMNFYETVMNRFLDSRFTAGHPLRILYLIMTNNENSALEEIRSMINNQEMPLFVQEIWTILINFLLRAKNESLVIAKIFEDIAKCLLEKKLFENSLVCFILSVLSGSKTVNIEVLEKIDYLLAWFAQSKTVDIINFSNLPLLNIILSKVSTLSSKSILWRCHFIKLMYAQYLHDLGFFNSKMLESLSQIQVFSKSRCECAYPSFFAEEFSILQARNPTNLDSIPNLSQSKTERIESTLSPKVQYNMSEHISPDISKDSDLDFMSSPTGFDPIQSSDIYTPTLNNIPIIASNSGSPKLMTDSILSTNNDEPSNNLQESNKTSPMGAKIEPGSNALFDKLKTWLPVKGSNQENLKQITKAKMGKPNSSRYDEKLKKWVFDNDPSSFEEAPKLPPPPTTTTNIVKGSVSPVDKYSSDISTVPNFRAKKGKVKYFDPLNPDGPNSSQLQPSVLNFDK